MKNLGISIRLVFLIMIVTSCGKDKSNPASKIGSCSFVQDDDAQDGFIDDSEKAIMTECRDNALSSKKAIEDNLIGEWELVGFGHGWFGKVSQPCGYIVITEDELKFEFNNFTVDTVTTYPWSIEETGWPGGSFFKLNVGSEYIEGLSITDFCENYMYGNTTPVDGNMYLYEKVN